MKLKISLPNIDEQTAIVNILNSTNHEINLTNQKLKELHHQRFGLMQQLLTGKKRIKY